MEVREMASILSPQLSEHLTRRDTDVLYIDFIRQYEPMEGVTIEQAKIAYMHERGWKDGYGHTNKQKDDSSLPCHTTAKGGLGV